MSWEKSLGPLQKIFFWYLWYLLNKNRKNKIPDFLILWPDKFPTMFSIVQEVLPRACNDNHNNFQKKIPHPSPPPLDKDG